MKLDKPLKLYQILKSRRFPVPLRTLADQLDCSERTVKYHLDALRNECNAPIDYIEGRGWILDQNNNQAWEMPGLWLTEQDIQSMLLLMSILERFDNGLLHKALQPVSRLINDTLSARNISRAEIDKRIKIIPLANTAIPDKHLRCVFSALVKRKQVTIDYCDYQRNHTHRRISPQRLIYYRDNWSIDAWCHRRNELRTFALSRISEAELTKQQAVNIPDDELDHYYSPGYGLFSGKAKYTARLRFFAAISREIAKQQWHPKQQGKWDGEDYLLTLPYSDPRELVQDILRHSPNVIVESPASLKNSVKRQLQAALALYEQN